MHSAVAIPRSKINPSNIYSMWRKVPGAKISHGRVKFKFRDLVMITKEKVTFTKGYEKTFSADIFRVVKVIQRVPQPVYELSDLPDRPIEGQFYNYELVKVTVSRRTEFQIHKVTVSRRTEFQIHKVTVSRRTEF